MLATTALWFRYQDDPILKGLTLDFSTHAVTGLVGANGCGKSTLFMNLSGLLRPQQGAVMWQGKPLDYSKRGLLALRQQVATVFQDPDQQIFIPISTAISPLACAISGWMRLKSHDAWKMRLRWSTPSIFAISPFSV
jgi:ABC-type cobalamin/Fe3+-siderophores transport system ATPase subunit